jgi:hypothetical protein
LFRVPPFPCHPQAKSAKNHCRWRLKGFSSDAKLQGRRCSAVEMIGKAANFARRP